MQAQHADLSSLRINRSAPNPGPTIKWWKFVVTAIAVLCIVALSAYVWNSIITPVPEVSLAAATLTSPAQSDAILTASGYVVAQRKAAVASKGTGRLVYLGVVEGDRVREDQIIARLEDNDIRAQLDQAKANLRLSQAEFTDAERSLNRTRALAEKQLASQAELDAAESRYDRVRAAIDVARATVAGAEVSLENTRIRAPFDGTVLTKNADVGEIVAPLAASASSRGAVVTIADMSSLEVEVDVSESNIQRVVQNQPCEISLDAYPDLRYQGFVSKIVPTADRAKATVLVKVAFRSYDSNVLPEMSAKALFLARAPDSTKMSAKPVLTVPVNSIVRRSDRPAVFIVRDNAAVEVPVKVGQTFGSLQEIVSGLSPGDRIVLNPGPDISDGVTVKVK